MVRTLPDVPEIGWFEMEILYYLMEGRRYGNEMRLMLNEHLGEESVTTGKLYPVLKKLEKLGYIKRLKVKKSDIEDMETGMRNILTRGVERKYFEITDMGKEEMEKALHFSSCIHFNRTMSSLHSTVKERLEEIILPADEDAIFGILTTPTNNGINRAKECIPDLGEGEHILLLLGSGKDLDKEMISEFEVDVRTFPCRFDDVPLKSNYLDSAISFTHLKDVPDPSDLVVEMVRTVRPGGQFILVDFAKMDSLILEDIIKHNLDIDGASDYDGEDAADLVEILEDRLIKVHVERYKELFIIHGKKRKKVKKDR